MDNSGFSDQRTNARVFPLTGANLIVSDAILEGEHIGTLVRVGAALVSAYPATPEGRLCNRCGHCAVLLDCLEGGGWEVLCAEHAYVDEWLSSAGIKSRLAMMKAQGHTTDVIAAYWNWASKRRRGEGTTS